MERRLAQTILETQEKLRKAQERYKKAFDKRLRNTTEDVMPGDNGYLRVERKDDTETRHKLALITFDKKSKHTTQRTSITANRN